jgi:hypothetical protein
MIEGNKRISRSKREFDYSLKLNSDNNSESINTLEGDLYAKILMERNKNLNFVDRANNPQNYPVVNNEDGSISTHKMAWGTDGSGQAYMFPTLPYNKNEDGSIKESIKVPNQYADYISSIGYKNATNINKTQ